MSGGVPLGGQGEPDRRDRLLVTGPGAILVAGALLAKRPAPVAQQIQKVVQGLYELADDTESPKGIVVDWSHRTHRNDHDGPAG